MSGGWKRRQDWRGEERTEEERGIDTPTQRRVEWSGVEWSGVEYCEDESDKSKPQVRRAMGAEEGRNLHLTAQQWTQWTVLSNCTSDYCTTVTAQWTVDSGQ